MIEDLIKNEKQKNLIDFNSKYLINEANALREKLKSRQSRTDSSNKPILDSPCENNFILKDTNDTENLNVRNTKQLNLKNLISNEENNNIYSNTENLNNTIKIGLEVEFNESGSTPNLSEILDSENELNLDKEELRKVVIKNLAKQYNFKTDEEIKNQQIKMREMNKPNGIKFDNNLNLEEKNRRFSIDGINKNKNNFKIKKEIINNGFRLNLNNILDEDIKYEKIGNDKYYKIKDMHKKEFETLENIELFSDKLELNKFNKRMNNLKLKKQILNKNIFDDLNLLNENEKADNVNKITKYIYQQNINKDNKIKKFSNDKGINLNKSEKYNIYNQFKIFETINNSTSNINF